MRKLVLSLTIAAACLPQVSCSYDDNDIWNAVDNVTNRVDALEKASDKMNSDIEALQRIVEALQNNVTVTDVVTGTDGYSIKFSDGTEAKITNGVDGLDAPQIAAKQDADGVYYWTVGGEWMLVDGNKVKANGTDGIAPKVQINPTTKQWEISTDNGATWQGTDVVAEGSSLFETVDASNNDYVRFVMADGTEFNLPRAGADTPIFAIEGVDGFQKIAYGTTQTYNVTESNVAQYTIQKPDGWRVSYAGGKLTVTAPVEENKYAEPTGTISVVAISESNKSMIVKFQVGVYELRVLTFEDTDAKFSPFTLDYCSKSINTWSDLIATKEYGDPLLYGDGYGMDEPYYWYDEGNTELMHVMPEMWGMYCYWSGGHAVSNHASTDIKGHGDFMSQLTVYGNGGNNGSRNFAIHFGYNDDSGTNLSDKLPTLEFYDGVERVIDHMYVNATTYALNCYIDGNGLTTNIGENDWVQLVAHGYDAAGTEVGKTTIYMCKGKGLMVKDWTRWDLSVLGKVAKVAFNVTGSSDNGYGFSQPAYFAYDDVAVRF
ncbi:MAG: DUF4988 and DUF4465 domain-containing protein [Paenibacillus sp.]|nr:DUF4988 and DUF4465 domain-containing protein [Paenibacillus sp.]